MCYIPSTHGTLYFIAITHVQWIIDNKWNNITGYFTDNLIGAIMAAFRDDMPLVVGINENWDEDTTCAQIVRPDWDFSPLRMKTMHHLPHIFFDTLHPERPDCPVLIPSTFSVVRDRIISQDIYSYEPCGLPTGDFMPAERAQIRLMTASPVTLRACIPAPDQVTPELRLTSGT